MPPGAARLGCENLRPPPRRDRSPPKLTRSPIPRLDANAGRDDARRDEDTKGGAEAHARYKQYQYKEVRGAATRAPAAKIQRPSSVSLVPRPPTDSLPSSPSFQNASLVLTSDRSERVTGGSRPARPSRCGGAHPAWRLRRPRHRSRPAELEERLKKSKEKRKGLDQDDLDAHAAKKKRQRAAAGASVLTVEADGSYRPKTRETRAAYEALLGMIQGQFGDQPADVLRGAAEEVLEVLKDDRSTDPKRKKDVEKLMGATSDERFGAQFVAVGKLITDFAPGGVAPGEGDVAPGDALDDDMGVAVEFEESEEDNDADEVLEASDVEDEDEGAGEDAGIGAEVAGVRSRAAATAPEPLTKNAVEAADIDAYWLQPPSHRRVRVHGCGGERGE